MTQPGTAELLAALCEAGYETLLETNGSYNLDGVDGRVRRIIDVKCPSSGAVDATCWENLDRLTDRDEVKFVPRRPGRLRLCLHCPSVSAT